MTKDAEKLLARMYKRYLCAIENGKPRFQARFMGSPDAIHHSCWPEISTKDIVDLCGELEDEGFLNCCPGDDAFMDSQLDTKAIEYMENRMNRLLTSIKDGPLSILDLISRFF